MEVRFQHQDNPAYQRLMRHIMNREFSREQWLLSAGDMLVFTPIVLGLVAVAAWISPYRTVLDVFGIDAVYWLYGLAAYVFAGYFYAAAWRPQWTTRLAWRKLTPLDFAPMTMRLQDEGLQLQSPIAHALFPYRHIRTLENAEGFLLIGYAYNLYHAVPHHAFADEKARLDFENALRAKLPPSARAT